MIQLLRTSLCAIAIATFAVIASLIAAGCGESPSFAQTTALITNTTTTTAKTAVAPRAAYGQSLHERVMAEQGRAAGVAVPRLPGQGGPPTTLVVASEPQSTTTAATGVSPNQGGSASIVLTGGQTPIKGVWSGTASRLASFLLSASPSPRFTVPASVLADYYVRYCGEAGIRADLLWAQMIHETGYGMYGGGVSPDENNFAGIGVTGDGAARVVFTSAQAGVMAQVAHMVAYVYQSSPVVWANNSVDPRFDVINPRGVVSVLSDLDGRWAVPGNGYGERIEDIVRAINSN